VAYLGFGKGGAWRAQSASEAERLFAFERSMEAANSPIFLKFAGKRQKTHLFI